MVEHCVSSAKVVGSILRKHTDKMYSLKSLWKKASAKCINVNVTNFQIRNSTSLAFLMRGRSTKWVCSEESLWKSLEWSFHKYRIWFKKGLRVAWGLCDWSSVPVETLCLESEGTEQCPPEEKCPAHQRPPAHQAPKTTSTDEVKH